MLKKLFLLFFIFSISFFILAHCCPNFFGDHYDQGHHNQHDTKSDNSNKIENKDDGSLMEFKDYHLCIYRSRNIIEDPHFHYL